MDPEKQRTVWALNIIAGLHHIPPEAAAKLLSTIDPDLLLRVQAKLGAASEHTDADPEDRAFYDVLIGGLA